MMKKLFPKMVTLSLMLILAFSFAACGNSSKNADDAEKEEAGTTESVSSDSDIDTNADEPRYTSDGELIVEEELPASDSDITTEE